MHKQWLSFFPVKTGKIYEWKYEVIQIHLDLIVNKPLHCHLVIYNQNI